MSNIKEVTPADGSTNPVRTWEEDLKSQPHLSSKDAEELAAKSAALQESKQPRVG